MCSYLLDVDFSFCLQSSDIEFVWFCIKSFIYEAIFLFTPKVYVKRCQGPKWFTSAIRLLSNCLKTLKKRFKFHPTVFLEQKIQHLEMLLCLKMKSAKTNFECSLVDLLKGGDSSTIYKYVRNFTGSNVIPQTIYLGNVCATTDSDKASLFNKYFHYIYSSVHCDLPSSFDSPQTSQMLGDISIQESEVYELLISLNTSKAMGCDGISPMLLKHCATALFQPLHHLFLLSIMHIYLPLEWRTHLIKPILKSYLIPLLKITDQFLSFV